MYSLIFDLFQVYILAELTKNQDFTIIKNLTRFLTTYLLLESGVKSLINGYEKEKRHNNKN